MIEDDPPESLLDSLRIPTLPSCVLRLREILNRDDCGLAEVADVVATDPPIAAKVLQVANSARYGLREKTLSIHKAATVLGVRNLTTIAMRAGVASAFAHLRDVPGFSLSEFWKHSVLTAQVASTLASGLRRRDVDLAPQDYYTCGLLHDIGQLVMYDSFGTEYASALAASATPLEILGMEEHTFMDLNHADVGGLSATMWQLPAPIPDVIYNHHRPFAAPAVRDIALLIASADEIAELVAATPLAEATEIAGRLRNTIPGSKPRHYLDAIATAKLIYQQLDVEQTSWAG
ncbi:MAG: HDOD domain-containing protein [Planctomycetes bacterium]|nr:HDOD domain-containing protein [Planctomycetota bacterium]